MHRARSFDPLPTVDEEGGCSKNASPVSPAIATSSSSPSLLPLLCKEGTYFYRLGQSFNASSIRIVDDPSSSLPLRKSATHLRNRSAQSFEDDFRPIRIVVGDNDDDSDGDARPTTGRRCCDTSHRSAPALRQDECASESLPRMPKRAWTSPSVSEMKNADFHNNDRNQEQSRNGTSKARKLALIFDMMMTPSNNGDGAAAARPILRAQHGRKRQSYPGGIPLQIPSNFSNGSNSNAGPFCRWSESSDHPTDSLPPIRPSRLDSLTKSDGNVGEDDEASITDTLENSFASFGDDSEDDDDSGESIVTLHSSCLSFSESFNKSYSSHESDLVPFPGPPCISEQQSPGAQAA